MLLHASPAAKRDLRHIYRSIARDRPAAAAKQIAAIRERYRLLVKQPLIGEAVDDISEGLRRITVGVYVIYFRPTASSVTIARVLHGAQDAETELRKP